MVDARGIVSRNDERAARTPSFQLAVEEQGSCLVETAVRLIEDEEFGIVQERAAKSEALQHAA